METIIGFIAGYLTGVSQGRDGMERARKSLDAIRTSPEVRRMVADGVGLAQGILGLVAKERAERRGQRSRGDHHRRHGARPGRAPRRLIIQPIITGLSPAGHASITLGAPPITESHRSEYWS